MNAEEKARKVIADVRDERRTAPPHDGAQPFGEGPVSGDAFDYWVATDGWHEYGAFYNACYTLANENHQAFPGCGQEFLDESKRLANALWAEVRPYIRAYYEDCRAAKFTGWSRQNEGPIRRVRKGVQTPITVPMAVAIEQQP
jgi:hypothetical protein